jgi:ATP-dependent helicase HrpA
VAEVLERMPPRRAPLLDTLAAELAAVRGVRVGREAFDLTRLAPHLRMTFAIEDEAGEVIASGKDLDGLRAAVRPRLQAELTAATAHLEEHGLTDWTLGDLPEVVDLPGAGGAVRAYPALVDEGNAVGVRTFDTPAEQAAAMHRGTRRLLALTIPSSTRWVRDRLDNRAQLTLAAAPHGSLAAVIADATDAAIDALMEQAGGPAWDAAGFARLRDHVAGNLAERTVAVLLQAVAVLAAARLVSVRMEGLPHAAFGAARDDVAAQVARLVHSGFLTETGAARLPDVRRYLEAAARRLERLPDAVAVDRDRMAAVHELETAYAARRAAWPVGRPLPPALREVPWLLEELRVAHFAQALGTRGPVSSKRIRRMLDEAVLTPA